MGQKQQRGLLLFLPRKNALKNGRNKNPHLSRKYGKQTTRRHTTCSRRVRYIGIQKVQMLIHTIAERSCHQTRQHAELHRAATVNFQATIPIPIPILTCLRTGRCATKQLPPRRPLRSNAHKQKPQFQNQIPFRSQCQCQCQCLCQSTVHPPIHPLFIHHATQTNRSESDPNPSHSQIPPSHHSAFIHSCMDANNQKSTCQPNWRNLRPTRRPSIY